MRRRLAPGELPLWIAYAHLHGPFWGERLDAAAASVCQTIAAANGHSATLDSFLIEWGGAEKKLVPFHVAAQVLEARFVDAGS